jgi:hypothetical protein
MIAMPSQQQYSRQYVVDMLKRLGYSELADAALRELPDPVDVTRVEAFCTQHGYSWDNDVISRMGGSP